MTGAFRRLMKTILNFNSFDKSTQKKKKNQRSFSCLTNYSSTSVLWISSFELRGPVSGQKVPIARVSVHCLVWLIILKSH